MSDHDPKGYWKSSIKIVLLILSIWFVVSFGCAIIFRDWMDANMPSIGNAKFGFWMAQQGSIICFVLLLVLYAFLMNKLDKKHGYDESSEAVATGGSDVTPETATAESSSLEGNEESKESE